MEFQYYSSSASSTELCTSPPRTSHKKNTGRKKYNETRHPIYRGVRHRNGSKWVCEVREPHKKSKIWLGTFSTPEMAARAYDAATLALRGKSSPLNFPDSAWLLPRAKSSSPREIKAAAFKAAHAFTPTTSSSSSSNSSSSNNCAQLQQVESLEKIPDISFWDEEAMFNMPGLLDSMAEGMLLTPLSMQNFFNWNSVDYSNIEMSLWSD